MIEELYEIRRGRLLCIGFYDMKVTAVNVKVIKNYGKPK